jgi:superfamily II DNA/RNA helicase
MLDMGFLPDIRRILRHIPSRRQTLFFSATMPGPIAELSREMLKDPATINLERRSAPATGITHAVYPVPQHLKPVLLAALLQKGEMHDALVFTRTKHRADRLAKFLATRNLKVERIHGNRSQSQRTEALAGFKSGKYRVLVATDIAARGIDVTALGHVVNFDVPAVPDDYIHRVGRTARAETTGSAFTLVSPEEEGNLRGIEKAIGKRLPRVTVPDFDYTARGEPRLEIPIGQRIAEIRARKAEERTRARANAERRAAALRGQSGPGAGGHRPRRRPARPAPACAATAAAALRACGDADADAPPDLRAEFGDTSGFTCSIRSRRPSCRTEVHTTWVKTVGEWRGARAAAAHGGDAGVRGGKAIAAAAGLLERPREGRIAIGRRDPRHVGDLSTGRVARRRWTRVARAAAAGVGSGRGALLRGARAIRCAARLAGAARVPRRTALSGADRRRAHARRPDCAAAAPRRIAGARRELLQGRYRRGPRRFRADHAA